ncbi:uncharacterized protein LOC115891684 [Sitophilus oryzae]|uniref:Uncharacterized protein LOC115891684 n=1 Tax=Sitophilus oryzae TaxID=7048 RepID=A0A6J2YY23_SITOR|nr:uncharacterized protein LOC115891684 [Sitophilus oryzae]
MRWTLILAVTVACWCAKGHCKKVESRALTVGREKKSEERARIKEIGLSDVWPSEKEAERWWTQLDDQGSDLDEARDKKKGGMKKKLKRYLLPLLIAYKLKFFTLIPVMIGGLVLLTGATGLAGFFFALFAAVMGLKSGSHH